jgi:hypothetical protein
MLSYFNSITVPGLEHITVFRDDEDATQFYAMPSTPRLARDNQGRLLLDLIIDQDVVPLQVSAHLGQPGAPLRQPLAGGHGYVAAYRRAGHPTCEPTCRASRRPAGPDASAGLGRGPWARTQQRSSWCGRWRTSRRSFAPGFETMTVALRKEQ